MYFVAVEPIKIREMNELDVCEGRVSYRRSPMVKVKE